MAKKEKIPAADIIDVISKYEAEIVNECNPEPVKVLELIKRDSGTISKYLCGCCHSVFNELSSKWLSGIKVPYCPICHNECTGSLIYDNECKKVIVIVIQEDRNLYFAIANIAFFYDDNLNIADSKFEYQNVGMYDLGTNEKSFYKYNPTTREHTYTTAQASTLFGYSYYMCLNFVRITDTDLPSDCYEMAREIDKRKKSIAKKEEEVPFPVELDDEPECPDVADILNIAVVCEETDEVLQKKKPSKQNVYIAITNGFLK